MKAIALVLLLVVAAAATQTYLATPTVEPVTEYVPVLLVRHPIDSTVIRVISADSLRFTGIVVYNRNGVICDTVSAYKSEYVKCLTCIDNCN